MYPNPIPISNGTATVNFDLRGSSIDHGQYKDASAALDQPHLLNVKHQTTGSGVSETRRTVVRIDRTVEDASGQQGTISVYLVVAVNPKVATNAQLTEQVTLMKSFLAAAGYVDKIVNAEI